ncbi:unnamed protein product [Lupinus luteus]|uniref:Isopenicillin N synthase-like Fe(2+) 2OG dioxygenase domain-containing protein n=1 Tax=Lupinus luteus TaxID=3873 RepID=A0AAV1XEK7_LUPLU
MDRGVCLSSQSTDPRVSPFHNSNSYLQRLLSVEAALPIQHRQKQGIPIMSNGIFKSPMHRVVTNTEKLRMSVAMFNEPEPENEIGPVEGLIDETRPRLYRNIKNYGDMCYQEGKITLGMIRIEDNSDKK